MAATSNYAAIVRPLQVLVMVVAVLFFLRIMRVAAVQARPIDYEKRSRRRRSADALALKFVEPTDRTGERIDVDAAVTIGRSADCDLSLSRHVPLVATRAPRRTTKATSRSKTSDRPTART